MNLASVGSFYRKAFAENAKIEDGIFINAYADIYGVTDGNSAAFSPKHPPLSYDGLTGAQMVNLEISKSLSLLSGPESLEKFLLKANANILWRHQMNGVDPTKGDDVGGACFSFCQPTQGGLALFLGGDSFALVEDKTGPVFFTGFDKAAFDIEKGYQEEFAKCKKQAGGNIGSAWDFYWPIYRGKRIFCKNRNISQGGDASLNGDPELARCWKKVTIPWDNEPKMVILGTDGLLPPTKVCPIGFSAMARMLHLFFLAGGVPAVLKWRDSVETEKASLTHIEGWPEAAAIELKFS